MGFVGTVLCLQWVYHCCALGIGLVVIVIIIIIIFINIVSIYAANVYNNILVFYEYCNQKFYVQYKFTDSRLFSRLLFKPELLILHSL